MIYDKATISITLDKRRQKNDKTYPVKIRVTYAGQPRYYTTGHYLTEADFGKVMMTRPRGEYKRLRDIFDNQASKARNIAGSMPEFSWDAFKAQLTGSKEKKKKPKYFQTLFKEYIDNLNKAGRTGSAISYGNALASFSLFSPKAIPINNLSPQYFERYESWMKGRGRAEATIGMYIRAARAIINNAIACGDMEANRYPFGKRGYKPPVGANVKKALTLEQVKSIVTYDPENEKEAFYRDFWVLSYLCNGANFIDILRLRKENIRNSSIVIRRQKTKRTKRGNAKPIVISLSQQVTDILYRWGDPESEGYIFPVLKVSMDEEKMLKTAKQFIKQTNKYINQIARRIGIREHITTYTARHTFATVMKRAGVPIAFISDSLGHSDIRVTERYLSGFEDSVRAKLSEALTDW